MKLSITTPLTIALAFWLPAFAQDKAPMQSPAEAIRFVKNAMKSAALGAMPVAPGGGRMLAIKIGVGVNVVLLAEADDDAVTDVGVDTAVMRVVRRADPGELMVVGVLIAVELLPVAVKDNARAG